MLVKIPAIVVLTLIAYHDFKHREIYWALFLFIALFFFIDGQTNMPLNEYLLNTLYNIIFVSVQFLFVYLFYRIRGIDFKSLINNIIGLGDILFITIMSLAFPWQSFLLYYIGGLVFTLFVWLCFKFKNNLIPFAGLLSIYCAIILILEFLLPQYERFSNELLKLLLYG